MSEADSLHTRRDLFRRASSAALWATLPTLAACQSTDLGEGGRMGSGGAGPSKDPAYYRIDGPPPRLLQQTLEVEDRLHQRYRYELEPPVPPELASVPGVKDPIEVVHWRPCVAPGERRGLVLMSPILGNSRLLMSNFAGAFLRRGWHAVLVFRKELAFDPQATLDRAEGESRLVVMRSVRVLDWALARDDVLAERCATFGVSAGAIVSSMLAGADPRTCAHVWILGGGSLADVIRDTEEDRFQAYRAATRAATGLDDAAIARRLEAALWTDPLRLAERVRPAEVLMVLARQDQSVPIATGWRLREALGRPRVVETPLGHYSTFVLLPWLTARTTQHIAARFEP